MLHWPGATLVLIWANWCVTSVFDATALRQICSEVDANIRLFATDYDRNPLIVEKFDVRGVPTLLLFKDGKLTSTRFGLSPEASLRRWLTAEL